MWHCCTGSIVLPALLRWCHPFFKWYLSWSYETIFFSTNEGAIFFKKDDVTWYGREVFILDIGCIACNDVSSLYTFLQADCILWIKMFYMTLSMKIFLSAFRLLWHTLYVNIVVTTMVINQIYCLVFGFLLYLKAVRIEASSPSALYTL